MDEGHSRRRVLALATGGLASLAGCIGSSGDGGGGVTVSRRSPGDGTRTRDESGSPTSVGLETLATGLRAPVDVAFASGPQYLVDQSGQVYALDDEGQRSGTALDLSGAIETGGEKGLLGIALHPEFASNRRLYLRYSAPRREGTPRGYSHTFVLAAFTASDDGTTIRRDTERTVLEIPQPQGNHNAGSLAFGPDGYLYVGVGDGGAGGDQGTGHVSDWYDAVGGGNGQDVGQNLLGSILRIDVDGRDSDRAYAIPPDNPLVGRTGLDEHYAWGLRNPWRMAFDGADLYVGDVGQNRFEEVDLVERGGNYGWNVREGAHCFGASSCPAQTPASVRGGEPLQDPIVEYPHTGSGVTGISVIGGTVYRGSALPGLDGTYVFGDLQAKGRLFTATRPENGDDGLWPTRVLPVAQGDAGKLQRVLSFGRDMEGEVYVLGTGNNGGGLHRVVPA